MKIYLLCLFALFFFLESAFACTSACVSPQRSTTGEVMIWKHRDYPMRHTGVKYVTGGKYAYVGLVSPSGVCYGGLNDQGFGITTNAVKNLKVDSVVGKAHHKYSLHVTALMECATVDDFEALLSTYMPRAKGFMHIIDVCDAQGNCAFFEIHATGYTRYDANKTNDGFVVRSNFGFSGDDTKRGASVRRYDILYKMMSEHKGNFSLQDIAGYGRSFNSIAYGDILASDDEYVDDNHCIQRLTSCADIVIVSGKNPRIFVCNGNSMAGMLIPVFVGEVIPKCLQMDGAMYQTAEEYHTKAYIEKSKDTYILNKPLVRAVAKKNGYKVYDPMVRPKNEQTLADKLDKLHAKFDKKVKKVLSSF